MRRTARPAQAKACKVKTRLNNRVFKKSIGAPWRIRTVDLGIRSPLLYPTELMEQYEGDYNLVELIAIRLADFINGTVHTKIPLFDPHSALANALDLFHRV